MFWVLELKIEKNASVTNSDNQDLEKEPVYHSIITEPQHEDLSLGEIMEKVNWHDSVLVNILGSAYKGWQKTENSDPGVKLKFYLENTFIESEIAGCTEMSQEVKEQVSQGSELIELSLDMTLKQVFWHIRLVEFPTIIAVTEGADRLFRMRYKNEKIRKSRLAAEFFSKHSQEQSDQN